MMELKEVVAIAAGGIGLLVTAAGTVATILWRVEDDRSWSEPQGEIREKRRESTVLAIIVPTIHRMSLEWRSAISEIPSFYYVNRIRRQSYRDRMSGILKVGGIAHRN